MLQNCILMTDSTLWNDKAMPDFRKSSISFFWVFRHNQLNKYNEGNLVLLMSVAFFFTDNSGHCVAYTSRRLYQFSNTFLTRQHIVDIALTLIVRMGQGLCHCPFGLQRLPIDCLCIRATKSPSNLLTEMTKNHWRSTETHVQHLAVSMSSSLLPMKASIMLVMHNSEQNTVKWPCLQDQTLVTHWWCSLYVVVTS